MTRLMYFLCHVKGDWETVSKCLKAADYPLVSGRSIPITSIPFHFSCLVTHLSIYLSYLSIYIASSVFCNILAFLQTFEGAAQYLRDWAKTMQPEYLMASTPHNFHFAGSQGGGKHEHAEGENCGATVIDRSPKVGGSVLFT